MCLRKRSVAVTVLTIIGVVVLAGGIFFALMRFNVHCEENFNYKFFSMPSCIASAAATWLVWGGYEMYTAAAKSGGDIYNGIALVVIGLGLFCGLVFFNFKRTNLLYGVGGSVLQLSLFVPLAYLSVYLIIAGFFLYVLCGAAVQRVHVVNK